MNLQDPPIANADSGSTDEDTTLPNIDILGNDSDPDNDLLTVISAVAANGTVTINPDGTIDYTPDPEFFGSDTINYTISDGNGGTDSSIVLINVVPVADPPTSADNTVTVDEDGVYAFVPGDFAFADTDPGDSLIAVRIDALPADGQLLFLGTPVTPGQVVSLTDLSSGRLTFVPDPDDFGVGYTTFDFSVGDGSLFQVTPNTMTVDVTPIQDSPVATDNAIVVNEESTGTPLGLAAPSDADGDPLTATVTGLPTLGTVFLADGTTPVNVSDTLTVAQLTSLVYDAPTDYIAGDPGDFTYDITDGIDTDSGLVDITVVPVNDPPQIDLNGAAAGEDYKTTFTEGGAAVGVVDPGVSISDVDSTQFQLVSIVVGGVTDGASEIASVGSVDFDLSINGTQAMTVGATSFDVAYASGTGTFTITGSGGGLASAADLEAMLASLSYRNESALPSTNDRTFEISIVDDLGGVSNAPIATVCVDRDAESASWSITGPATVVDGNVATHTLTLSAALRDGENASVDLALTDIDTNSSDYALFATAVSDAVSAYSGPGNLVWDGTTLTFTSDGTGPMSGLPIDFTTTPDNVYEGDEDFSIDLTNGSSTTGETISIATASATTTIIDEDAAPTLTIGNASATEGSPLQFTLSLDTASFEDMEFDLAVTSGSATAGTDVESSNFEYWDGSSWQPLTNGTEVTFTAGTTSVLIRIDSIQDGLVEPDETFTLGATVLAGTVTDASDTGSGTIVNDDVGALNIDDVTIDEDNGTIVFTVSLDQPSASTVTVDYATSSGSATSGIDFTAASGTLTFVPGDQTETITVSVANDSLFEQSETFGVNLSAASGASIGDGLGVGTIIDDGSGPNGTDDDRPVISVNDVTATEDVDTHAIFTVALSNPSTQPIELSLALTDVTAIDPDDYGPGMEYFDGSVWQPVAGNVTIAAGDTSIQIRTAVVDDPIIDTGETFTLTATLASGITFNASDIGTGTILDDPVPDATTVSISGSGSVTEGSLASYLVSIDNTPLTDVTVTFTYGGAASGATDYTGVATVTIPAGSTGASFDIATIDDMLGEPLEDYVVTIDSISGGSLEATAISPTSDSVTTNIIDDDVPSIGINDVFVTEGSDIHAEFTVELSNPTWEDIIVSLSASAVSANGDGVDFGILGSDELEVFDGTTWTPLSSASSLAGTTSLRLRTPIIDDVFAEPVETFTVTATVTGGTTSNPSATGTGSIQDDTTNPEVVSTSISGPATVVEGDTTTNYAVSLTHVPVEDVTVTLVYSGTAVDGPDFAGLATVTIPTGSATATFTLPTIDDSLYEISEDIVITIDSVTGGGFESIAADPTADDVTTTITDVADIPTVSVNDVTSIEGTDSFAIYTIELSNLSVEDINFDLALADGTAVGAGTDYGAAAAGNLQVFDGSNWGDASSAVIPAGLFTVQARTPVVDDNIDEPTESYSLTVDVTGGTTTNAQVIGAGTILDEDPAPDVTVDDATADEGDPLVFDITLSNPSSDPIVLDLSTTDLSATTVSDYRPPSNTPPMEARHG